VRASYRIAKLFERPRTYSIGYLLRDLWFI